MRIMRDSFEGVCQPIYLPKGWARRQGENLKNILLSTADIAEILDIAEATASELVAKEQFELTLCLWETPYRKEQFRAMVSITVLFIEQQKIGSKDQAQFGETLTMPQIARFFGRTSQHGLLLGK